MKHLWIVSAALFLGACQTTAERTTMAHNELLSATLAQTTFAQEDKDWNVSPRTEIRVGKYHAPTPTVISGVSVIKTGDLLQLVQARPSVLLVDVLGGDTHATIPKAIWLKGAGTGESFTDSIQQKLGDKLHSLSEGDKKRPMVFFCLSSECWLSYNAALRAAKLGYSNVYWYRGGLQAWKAAGLPTAPSR